jgi:hypothetical protein
MILSHIKGLLVSPSKEWIKIRDEQCSVADCYIQHALILAAIPAISAYIGATLIGWDIGDRNFKFTAESTIPLVLGFYIASLIAIGILGKTIHWMSDTYGTSKKLSTCISLATAITTPLFISGVFALIPVPWLIFLTSLTAIAYSVYLLYSGIPIVMGVNPEKGFLYASAVLTMALVIVVGILVVTVIFWSMGLAPIHA